MKQILFNTEMVRALLEGRKTATRRVVKPQPVAKLAYVCMGYKQGTWNYPEKDNWMYWNDESFRLPDSLSNEERNRRWMPPCHAGDILYVKETWCQSAKYIFWYKADSPVQNINWKPSIHMPREAARIFLRVKNVKVERLQEITEEQTRAEGAQPFMMTVDVDKPDDEKRWQEMLPALSMFPALWDSTIKPAYRARYGWDANPWVWVITFERISKEEALHE